VTPIRAANGWRAYGPTEMARLHQVLALKGLGLPLKRIAVLLAGRLGALDAVLELQEDLLQRQSDRLGRALTLVQSARKRLASGASLSIDDLTHLTLETTMTAKPTQAEIDSAFAPHIAKHFTPEDRATLAVKPYDQAAVSAAWDALFADAKALMEKGDPTSPAALDLARRWKEQVSCFSGGNPDLERKGAAVLKDAMADPASAPKLPLTPELFHFVGLAIRSLTLAQNIP